MGDTGKDKLGDSSENPSSFSEIKASLHEEKASRLALAIIFIAGFGLRLAYLFQPLRADEAANYIQEASQPLLIGLRYYPAPNNHLLNTSFVHFSTRIFGSAEWAIRLPALIFGLLIIPVTYLVIRRLLGRYPALFATAVVAFAPAMVSYSTNARGYSVQTLIFLCLVCLSLDIREKGMNVKRSALFVLLSSLGFYAIPTMLFFWVGLVIWLAISAIVGDTHDAWGKLLKWLGGSCAATMIITFLLYLPVIEYSGLKSLIANHWIKPMPGFLSYIPLSLKSIWALWYLNIPLVIGIIVFTGFLLSMVFYRKICRCRVNLMLVLVISSATIYLIQRAIGFSRTWLPLFPLYFGFSFAGLFYGGKWLGTHIKSRKNVVLRTKGYMPEVLAIVVMIIFTLLLVAQIGYPLNDEGTKAVSNPSIATVLKAIRPHMGKSSLLCVNRNEWTNACIYQYYYERLGFPIAQFAPNERMDAGKESTISQPSEYILLFTGDKDVNVLASSGKWINQFDYMLNITLSTAQERGLHWFGAEANAIIFKQIQIGDYHVFFAKNNL